MATQTTNYNLSKPDASDPFSSFRASYNDNMDIIDANLGGGGGGSGHTIIDENDNPMTQRTGLHFEGNVEVTDDSVNDETNVNVPYEVVHLTQAQYDALPNTKLTDGKVYCITDIPAFGDNLVFPMCYSEEEREIGCWTDGKPLYQRTYLNIALSNNQNSVIDSSFIDKSLKHINIDYFGSGNVTRKMDRTVQDSIFMQNNALMYWINASSWWTGYSKANFTIQYTKTTDTAGSGNWTPTGVPSVHYSTSEQVIGTWLGKTLYQKTWTGLSTATSGTSWVTLSGVTIANLENVVDAKIYRLAGGSNLTMIPIAEFQKTGTNGVAISIVSSSFNGTINVATIQYTKT